MRYTYIVSALVTAITVGAGYGLYYLATTPVVVDEAALTRIHASSTKEAENIVVFIPDGQNRHAVVEKVVADLSLPSHLADALYETYRMMQWDAFNEFLPEYFTEKYDLSDEELEMLLTHSAAYLGNENDILSHIHASGTFTFTSKDSVAHIAERLIKPVLSLEEPAVFVHANISTSSADALVAYIREEHELLPDLVPLPPLDMGIRYENGETLLVFSTIYYNQGEGDLELRADPSTIGVIGDFERGVSQRIYRTDDTYRDRPAGVFMWHAPHLHYHFADFVTYALTNGDGSEISFDKAYLQKSTFCIRDVSRVEIQNEFTPDDAKYKICGRERQGITVGWGDAYFQTYPDQNIPITGLASGTYRLTFNVNPEDRFDEITKDNNDASALFAYDKEAGTIDVVETVPALLPNFEHIYIEQQL